MKSFSEMPSPFNVKGEVILRNALTFKVKPEGISENPFTIDVKTTPSTNSFILSAARPDFPFFPSFLSKLNKELS